MPDTALTPRIHTTLWASIGLASGYAWILFWFAHGNFYHIHFFDHGSIVTLYQVMRVLFMAYLAWLIYAVGIGTLTLCKARDSLDVLPAWERYPLAFLTGAGVLHLLLFIVGLAGLYTRPVAVSLTLAVIVLSIPHMAVCLHRAFEKTGSVNERSPLPVLILYALLTVVIAAFLLTKGTYPGGDLDYYNHYFSFYKRVIETGSILPNDVWYQFYYSKGAGLHFLSMLLTDPLAPQLVGSVFFLSGACMVFALLKRACSSSVLPLTGAILYIAFFIYTPGPVADADTDNTGWGLLEKIHELTAALMLGMVWISTRLFEHDKTSARPWMIALQCTVFTAILLTLPLAIFIGMYMGLLFLWFLWKQERSNAWCTVTTILTAAIVFCLIAGVNYFYTGIPSDQLILTFWNFANLQTLQRWGVMFEAVEQHKELTAFYARALPWSWGVISLAITFLRLDIWWPLMVGSLPLLSLRLYKSEAGKSISNGKNSTALYLTLGAYVLTVILFSLFGGGRSQYASFYRFCSFSYGAVLCVVLLLWKTALGTADKDVVLRRSTGNMCSIFLFFTALITIVISSLHISDIQSYRRHIQPVFANASDLWSGHFSLKDAYQNQQGLVLPYHMPWGGIYPGIETPWKIVGPNTRIWSFHVHSYCMLPDCNVQRYFSMRFSPHWQTVLFDTPAHGAAVLRAEGLNYFFFSKELDFRDPFANAPLFSPEHIAENLAIRWTDGTSYLLTWPGPDTHPIDHSFLDAYSTAVKHASAVQNFPLSTWKAISDHINRHAQDLHPFRLPWCTTCDMLPIQPLD